MVKNKDAPRVRCLNPGDGTYPVPQFPTTSQELSPDFTASAGYGYGANSGVVTDFTGDKFYGGFGETKLYVPDYWTLRARSEQIFKENIYARGIVRRLVTNEINTGLSPEAVPDEVIIGVEEGSLAEWSEAVENRFGLWGKNPQLCDWKGEATFGAIQRTARAEALIAGDVLVVIRAHRRTGLPAIQLIKGDKVQSPLGGADNLPEGYKITHGVEQDRDGRITAHYVTQPNSTSKRIPARGARSGRLISKLIYGTDRRVGEVRGEPILAIVLQSLREVDRYRDSAQRKAVINSLIAMQVVKTQDKMGTLPVGGGATRKTAVTVDEGQGARQLNVASFTPGMIVDEMQHGEEIKMMGGDGTDVNFGPFEETLVSAIAWALEIPPEILKLSFSNNYSASQAAINEFKIAINKTWGDWGETLCTPIFIEWLITETLQQKIKAPSLLSSWKDPAQHDVFGAWTAVEWYGSIKPSTDMLKTVKASTLLCEEGFSTRAREARVTTGTKWTKNVSRMKRENELLAEAMRPMAEFRAEFGAQETEEVIKAMAHLSDNIEALNNG